MSNVIGFGHSVSWEGGFLFIATATGITPVHSHYAIQIAFGATHGIRFRASEREPWTAYDGVVISSRQPHTMDATQVPCHAVIFVDPETRAGRALAERFRDGGISALPADLLAEVGPALFESWQVERSVASIARAAQAVIGALTAGVQPMVVSDERILRATAYIRSHLDRTLTLDEVAAVACLSPSRFRHLFVEETGMALRPYILWRRFLRVWELMMERHSLSSAAHAAGFADAAHLTRTCHRMFGFPPSALQFGEPLRTGDEDTRSTATAASARYPAPSSSHRPTIR